MNTLNRRDALTLFIAGSAMTGSSLSAYAQSSDVTSQENGAITASAISTALKGKGYFLMIAQWELKPGNFEKAVAIIDQYRPHILAAEVSSCSCSHTKTMIQITFCFMRRTRQKRITRPTPRATRHGKRRPDGAGTSTCVRLGDFANVKDQAGVALPQLAAVARQAGRYCGRAIVADAKRQDIEGFAYHDKGILTMVGRNAAISELGSHHHPVNGPFAFVTWLGVHAALLADLRAETEAIFEWVVDYARGVPMNPLRIESEDTSHHAS